MARSVVIGICAPVETAWWGNWSSSREAVVLTSNYVDAVERAGAYAVVVPPHKLLGRRMEDLYGRVDGMVLAGGCDVDPASFGAEKHPAVVGEKPGRDAFELAVARYGMETGKPLLGICRGMQVMNVAAGGTLHQHLPDTLGHDLHCPTPGTFECSVHDVRLQFGSRVATLAGSEQAVVISHHHQGLDRIGECFTVTGWSSQDNLPEAIEIVGDSLVVGVQWHPEADPHSGVVERFIGMIQNRES